MSESNYFHCPICQDITRHIRLSSSEYMTRYSNGNVLLSIAGRINDLTGGGRLANAILGVKQWKCSKCCVCSQRKLDGTIAGNLF